MQIWRALACAMNNPGSTLGRCKSIGGDVRSFAGLPPNSGSVPSMISLGVCQTKILTVSLSTRSPKTVPRGMKTKSPFPTCSTYGHELVVYCGAGYKDCEFALAWGSMEGDGVACCDGKHRYNHGRRRISPPLPQGNLAVVDKAWKICKSDAPDYRQNRPLEYAYDSQRRFSVMARREESICHW